MATANYYYIELAQAEGKQFGLRAAIGVRSRTYNCGNEDVREAFLRGYSEGFNLRNQEHEYSPQEVLAIFMGNVKIRRQLRR